MSSTFMGTQYSPSSPPATSSSTTVSPIVSPGYPDRPIKPLPKRSLKDRLSTEAADSISYPPAPATASTPFYIPYLDSLAQRNGSVTKAALRENDKALHQKQTQVEDDKRAYQFRGNELPSEDEDDVGIVRRYQDYQQRQPYGTVNGQSHDTDNNQSIASSNDSADGYDSFENTNNKKKRKIPTSINLSASMSTSLTQDLANMGLSNNSGDLTDGVDHGTNSYSGVAMPINTSGTGISGAGRGRFGRNGRRDASGRQPLHSSVNGSNAWSNGKIPVGRKESLVKEPVNGDRGIISQAIADAAALPNNLSRGQENVSLLEQHTPKKASSANTQFTFTYEPDASNKPVWPGKSSMSSGAAHYDQSINSHHPPTSQHARKDFSTHGTQTSPPMPAQAGQDSHSSMAAEAPRKPRRSATKRYALAARERRAQQEYNNSIHPLKEEDFWICEFCEYESIFGRPPEALIRQYERKDEKERKRQAEKRRLLEKAKMKGRKGKKGSKGQAKAANSVHSPPPLPPQPPYDPNMSGQYQGYDPGAEDEYYGDEYDEPGPTPAPSPEMLSQLSQTGNHTHRHASGDVKKMHPRYERAAGAVGA